MKIVFLFVDGVGIAKPAADNPVNAEVCPTLWRLLRKYSKPIDACLGVDGPPQSATGQATMFTGVNCAAAMGRHCEGFPGQKLREIVQRDNLFLSLRKMGKKVRFADAYLVDSADELVAQRFKFDGLCARVRRAAGLRQVPRACAAVGLWPLRCTVNAFP